MLGVRTSINSEWVTSNLIVVRPTDMEMHPSLPRNRISFNALTISPKELLGFITCCISLFMNFNEFLAQTWLTHLETPINELLEPMPLKSHAPISINGGHQYLHEFRERLDAILENTWNEFERSNWEVRHQVKATNWSDEVFTRQYAMLTREGNLTEIPKQ